MFFCSKWSPVMKPDISSTDPPVAITHIFCGEIVDHEQNGVGVSFAEGFHSRPDNQNPKSAKISNPAEIMSLGLPTKHCPYMAKAKNVMVLDARKSKWVPRIPDSDQYFMFFPSSWGKHGLVQHIIDVFHACTNGQNNPNCVLIEANNRLTLICMRNYDYEGCSNHNLAFKIFLSWREDRYLVVTAFPDKGC